ARAVLIGGYLISGAIIDRMFGPDDRKTPCVEHPDGVDYVPIGPGRAFLIQLLNIAGLGPIFGALSGAIWGPSVYLWIVFGTIFAGAVHDYLVGMLSIRNDGASVSEITGKYLGFSMKQVMRVFSVVLLVMVGVVFMVGPAGLLAKMIVEGGASVAGAAGAAGESASWMPVSVTSAIHSFVAMVTGKNLAAGEALSVADWTKVLTVVILIYYFLATLLPIDKLIGKIYPLFGLCLIIMALGIGGATVMHHLNGTRPMIELWEGFYNMHPNGASTPIWPLMFITVACGAISGFHATQSPMMARCLTSERQGRFVFYGAMVAEGIIALIWASAGIAFYNATDGGFSTANLLAVGGGNSTSVYEISVGLLGTTGGILALLGVVACPITSGDTAFRSARLTLADWFKIDQKPFMPRLALALPLLAAGYAISFINYGVVWRYFSWSNQTLAMIALWAGAVYLARNVSAWRGFVAAVPACFMSAVSFTYFCYAGEYLNFAKRFADGVSFWGISMDGVNLSYAIGIIVAIAFMCIFIGTFRAAA
ncbi:MAG: carbon starvation protein A, partial [Synergistaceae bacterium]|nr:carbon starvation protein A [Synergistaceae bacterium]